ncbi:hypothetical protein [Streptomyces sp. NPDC057052]|uniref:hypothetical protein n=1 Tax=Streptomyces sp. NPDC057052 TaxID=3346010 RepID=UPI003627A47A
MFAALRSAAVVRLAGAVVREKLRITVAARGRAHDVVAHQQAAMLEEYLEGHTADPATWTRTLENLKWFAVFTHDADARRRAIAKRKPE